MLYPCSPVYLTENDIRGLVKLAEISYIKTTAEELVERVLQRELDIWKIKDDQGLVVTGILETQSGRTLWIEGIVGRDLIKIQDELWQAIERLAKNAGAKAIAGQTTIAAVQRLFEKQGARGVAATFEKRIG